MIEIISAKRCIECDICVRVCPANVFDAVRKKPPVIARQEDCQTCFLCEIYCPTDALYVAPHSEGPTGISEAEVESLVAAQPFSDITDAWHRAEVSRRSEEHTSELQSH